MPYSLDHVVRAGEYSYLSPRFMFMPKFLQYTLADPTNRKQVYFGLSCRLLGTFDRLVEEIREQGGLTVYEEIGKTRSEYAFLWDNNSFITLTFIPQKNHINVAGFSVNNTLSPLFTKLNTDYQDSSIENKIFTLVQSDNKLVLTDLVLRSATELLRGNYTTSAMEGIDYVLNNIASPNPSGRICILNGEPGTGKTNLIRSFLGAGLDCAFILIPSNLVESLDKPTFLPLLIQAQEEHKKPLVLVIEDGDSCLVPRKGDNMSAVSSLLNLSDGILGSILDLRIIITTNAEIKEMDAAILREGRLCKQIYLGPLPYTQANEVYQRLLGDSNKNLEIKKYYTLAEVYHAHANVDAPAAHVTPLVKKAIGF